MELAMYNADVCKSERCEPESIRNRLERRKVGLEADLKRVNDAIAALDAAPETAKVLELISKV